MNTKQEKIIKSLLRRILLSIIFSITMSHTVAFACTPVSKTGPHGCPAVNDWLSDADSAIVYALNQTNFSNSLCSKDTQYSTAFFVYSTSQGILPYEGIVYGNWQCPQTPTLFPNKDVQYSNLTQIQLKSFNNVRWANVPSNISLSNTYDSSNYIACCVEGSIRF
jgi:hypothetical protein